MLIYSPCLYAHLSQYYLMPRCLVRTRAGALKFDDPPFAEAKMHMRHSRVRPKAE